MWIKVVSGYAYDDEDNIIANMETTINSKDIESVQHARMADYDRGRNEAPPGAMLAKINTRSGDSIVVYDKSYEELCAALPMVGNIIKTGGNL